MKHKSKYYFLIAGFLIGFILSLIGMTIDDYLHQLSLSKVLKDYHYFFVPFVFGILMSATAFLYWRKSVAQKNTYTELIKNQARNQTMISNISDVIAIIDTGGIITYKSPNILQHFGWNPEDLVGISAWETTHPDDLLMVQDEFLKLLEKENHAVTIRYRYKCKDGNYKHIRLTAINLLHNPDVKGILCNYHDISEKVKIDQSLIENEYKYRTLFENMTDVVCILDNEKRIIDINPAAYSLYEYTKDELLKMSVDQIVYKGDRHISDEYFQKLENTGSYNMYEGRMITKTGKIKWIQVNSTEFIQNGKKIGSQDIIRDITQRKNIEIELQQVVQQLQELNATKDKLFSIIAHDLKSPFNSILGFANLINKNIRVYDIEKTEMFNLQIIASAKSTLNLLENLLSWAKNQTGQLGYNPEKVNLSDAINEVIGVLNASAKIKTISLNDFQSDNVEVYADVNLLKIILLNLVSNAIKFVEPGGKIEIFTEPESDTVEITVSDDGIGMDAETISKLFSIETTKPRKGTANEKGSGLGLILCKEFVEKQGGEIWIKSELGKGSQFKFTVPLFIAQ